MSAIKVQYDATANDSDKSWTVGTNRVWKIKYGHVQLTSTITAGNRQLDILVTDESSQTVLLVRAGAVQAASLVYEYSLLPEVPRETSVVALSLNVGIPEDLILLPGWTIRVYDSTAVDAAADDMVVSLVYEDMPLSEIGK